jgi:hypothetical protein
MKDIFWKLYGEAITGSNETGDVMDIEFFCELIVKECAKQVTKELKVFNIEGDFLLEYFGIKE